MSTEDQEINDARAKLVHDKRWDYLLIRLFLTIENFPTISKNDDFEKNHNIGLSCISIDRKLLQCGHIQESIDFVQATYKNISFAVGGIYNNSYLSDGDPYNTLAIALWIQNKHVLTINYHDRISAGICASDFDVLFVEQLNENPLIDELLLGLETELQKRRQKDGPSLQLASKDYSASWSEIYY